MFGGFFKGFLKTEESMHCKKVTDFPVPSLDITNQILPGRENRELFYGVVFFKNPPVERSVNGVEQKTQGFC